LHQIRRRRGHPPAQARRAKSPTFARKGHQTALAAALALEAAKASTEQAAVQVTLQLLADEAGQRDRDRPLVDRPVERLEVVTHDRVQRRRLGAMAFVDERCVHACGATPREHRPPCATSTPAPRPCDPATLRRSQSGQARSRAVLGHPSSSLGELDRWQWQPHGRVLGEGAVCAGADGTQAPERAPAAMDPPPPPGDRHRRGGVPRRRS